MKRTINTIVASMIIAVAGIHTSANAAPVNIGGFISNGYIESSHYNYLVNSSEGSFDFVEMGVNAVWSPIDRTTINGQLFTFELGPYGNYDPLVDYLFIDYSVTNSFGVRAGRVKRPLGVYNEILDIDIARTSILLPIGMYDQRYRDFSASLDGLSLYGSFALGKLGSIDYNLYHGYIDLSTDGGYAGFAVTTTSRSLSNAYVSKLTGETNSGGQIWWNTPLSGLRTGYSYSYYPDVNLVINGNLPPIYPPNPMLANAPISTELAVDAKMHRVSFEYYVGEWTFVSELDRQLFMTYTFQTVAGFPMPADKDTVGVESWYISASRRLPAKFSAGLTYAEFYGDLDNHNSTHEYNKDWQFSVRYDATDYWSLKAEFHSIAGTNRLFNQYGQNPVLDEENWTLIAAKSSFSF